MAKAHVDIELRWFDQDAYGHVNNVTIFRLLEEARVRLFWKGATREDTSELAGHFRGDGKTGPMTLVASQKIQYLRVLEYSTIPVTVEIWIGKFGGSSFEVHYQILDCSGVEPVVCVRAVTTLVMVNRDTMRPERLDEKARQAAAPWQDEPLELAH